MNAPITVVGVTEAGDAALSVRARDALAGADWVLGGARHFELLDAALPAVERVPWSRPLQDSFARLDARGSQSVVVLASGEPQWHGIATTLIARYGGDAVTVVPAVGAFSLAAAALSWPLEQTHCRSLHAHDLAMLAVWCYPGARLLLLSDGADAPREIAARLRDLKLDAVRLRVFEHLGGPRQASSAWLSPADGIGCYAELNLVALDVPDTVQHTAVGAMPGLPDEAFAHDGQLTKRSVRAATLAKLRPLPGQCLWDLGAGCGSVAIEWVRAALALSPGTPPAGTVLACAVERNPARVGMLEHNRVALGTPQLAVYASDTADVIDRLPPPSAIFVGGGLTQWRGDGGTDDTARALALIARCIEALPVGGRLVANAVTLASEAALVAAQARHGGDLERLMVSTSQAVGRYTALQPSMAVLQWCWTRLPAPSADRAQHDGARRD
ncbi:MAG: precorrin-6y C5,15-methyltransferase (decarboxylating) subunit CbiE [Pseudomonadota bacterium]